MTKGIHRIPLIDYEGRNLEEKEIRHDLDTKLSDIRDIRNHRPKGVNK
ncbi:MAG TPA: hypothetical protein VFD57_01565 [Clostridia bacterium]|nr:hypothetical protein [Clostridia bacterium]